MLVGHSLGGAAVLAVAGEDSLSEGGGDGGCAIRTDECEAIVRGLGEGNRGGG